VPPVQGVELCEINCVHLLYHRCLAFYISSNPHDINYWTRVVLKLADQSVHKHLFSLVEWNLWDAVRLRARFKLVYETPRIQKCLLSPYLYGFPKKSFLALPSDISVHTSRFCKNIKKPVKSKQKERTKTDQR
jgi:hypothetical protein